VNGIKRWFQSVVEFLKEVQAEVAKVSFPMRSEVVGSTTVVILLTLIVSFFLAFMDAVLVRLLRWVV
jgi:preprotein translocase subunit SecE